MKAERRCEHGLSECDVLACRTIWRLEGELHAKTRELDTALADGRAQEFRRWEEAFAKLNYHDLQVGISPAENLKLFAFWHGNPDVERLQDELRRTFLQNRDLVEAVRDLLRVRVCGSAEEALAREKVKALLPPLTEKRYCECGEYYGMADGKCQKCDREFRT